MAALRTVRRLTGGSRGFSEVHGPRPNILGFRLLEIFVFFGGLGPSRPPNSAKLFLGQPHYSGLRKKKVHIFFFDRQWVETSAKPRFTEIEIEKKNRFLIEKFLTPNYPEIWYVVPRAPAVQGSGGAH